MRQLLFIIVLVMVATTTAYSGQEQGAKSQLLYQEGSQKSFKGPADYFTGDVRVQMLFPPNEIARFSGAYVTFQPGARTNWHLHPAGQHMIVTHGVALTGTRDGKVIEFKEGETVWCPVGIDHWHGATPDAPMTHLVITGSKDGQAVVWKEKVTDEQYMTPITEARAMQKDTTLDARQQSIITIAAFTTSGDIERLKPALNEGLDAGLTVNEVKEVLVQMYAYAGFPRSLGGIWTFMGVMDERKAKGIEDEVGKEASPVPADLDRDAYGERVRAELSGLDEVPTTKAPYQEFSPIIDTFLKEHLFADIFARDILTYQERELATIACLASLGGAQGPLKFHMGAAMNTGLSEEQMRGFIRVLDARVGKEQAEAAEEVLAGVLADRK